MRCGSMPMEIRGRTKVCAKPVEIGNAACDNDRKHDAPGSTRKKAALQRERGQSMGYRVHGFYLLPAASFTGPGTSKRSACGTIRNSTGKRASGSPSTCA